MNTFGAIAVILYTVIGLGFAVFVLYVQKEMNEKENLTQALIAGTAWPIMLVALAFSNFLTPR